MLPFEIYAQAPLRLLSWCSFELRPSSKRLLRELAILCENPTTTTQQLVDRIAQQNTAVQSEHDATQHLAALATVQISSRAQLPDYMTMVQHFLGKLQLPMAIHMLDYYLPMLSPNEGYNETDLTMQSAGPIMEPWQPLYLRKVQCGRDTFAFRHPSLAQTDVYQLLESDAHHHGRLVAKLLW